MQIINRFYGGQERWNCVCSTKGGRSVRSISCKEKIYRSGEKNNELLYSNLKQLLYIHIIHMNHNHLQFYIISKTSRVNQSLWIHVTHPFQVLMLCILHRCDKIKTMHSRTLWLPQLIIWHHTGMFLFWYSETSGYLILIQTVMSAWVEHGDAYYIVLTIKYNVCLIIVDKFGKSFRQRLTTNFMSTCDTYFRHSDNWCEPVWQSFQTMIFVQVCLTIKFCTIQICPL